MSPASRPWRPFARESWIAGLVVFILLLFVDVATTRPPLPPVLNLQLKFPSAATPGRTEPIVATGIVGHGDFLLATYREGNVVVLTYESWGKVLSSPPIVYKPGERYPVQLEMPSLAMAGTATTGAAAQQPTGALQLNIEDVRVFSHTVYFHPCSRHRIFFGENPVGGPTVGVAFSGEIFTAEGKKIQGNGARLFPPGSRVLRWLSTQMWHLPPLLLIGLGVAWATDRLRRRKGMRPDDTTRILAAFFLRHGWFLVSAAVSLFVFTWLMTGAKFRLIYPDAFGAFYDAQMQSLLRGRFDVPAWSITSEAFFVGGKYYGYFGLTPALLRLPFVLCGEFGFGHMTRSWLLIDYFACLAGAYTLLGYITSVIRGNGARPSAWAIVLLTTSVGLGSALLFLACRVYVYHEAILCGVAFAIWSAFFSFRHLRAPEGRWWMGALVCGILSVQARPTTGLFALGLLGFVAAAQLFAVRRHPRMWRRPLTIGTLAVVGFLSLQAVAYLKFGTTEGAPLRYHVQYSAERIAKIENRNFHLSNIHHNLDAYFLRPAFRAGPRFPFLIFDLETPTYPGAKMDLEERIVGILYSMTGLFLLTLAAGVAAIKILPLRQPVLLLALAAAPLVACMLTFIATSHRYTADFCPLLITGAAIGVAFLDNQPRVWRWTVLSLASLGTVFAFALTLGIAFHFQVDLVWGVPEEIKSNFLRVREKLDPFFKK